MRRSRLEEILDAWHRFGTLPPPVSGGDGTEEDGEEDDEEEEDEESEEEATKTKGDDSRKKSEKVFKPITSQEDLDRRVQRRLKAHRKSVEAEVRQQIQQEQEQAVQQKAGEFGPTIKAKDDRIKTLEEQIEADQDELETYRELVNRSLEAEMKGLPKNARKLLPDEKSPLEQLEWLREFKKVAGLVEDDDEADDGEDDEAQDDGRRRRADAAKTGDRTKNGKRPVTTVADKTTLRTIGRRPQPKSGEVPKPEELLEKARKDPRFKPKVF